MWGRVGSQRSRMFVRDARATGDWRRARIKGIVSTGATIQVPRAKDFFIFYLSDTSVEVDYSTPVASCVGSLWSHRPSHNTIFHTDQKWLKLLLTFDCPTALRCPLWPWVPLHLVQPKKKFQKIPRSLDSYPNASIDLFSWPWIRVCDTLILPWCIEVTDKYPRCWEIFLPWENLRERMFFSHPKYFTLLRMVSQRATSKCQQTWTAWHLIKFRNT